MSRAESAVILGCDHAAFPLKEKIKAFLTANGIEVEDVGTHSEESVDYPDYAIKVAEAISNAQFKRGILICGTGLGMSMVANKFPRVRAALCNDLFSAILGRQHNDANILVMGGRMIGETLAEEIVGAWLKTPYEGGRHQSRLAKFESYTKIQSNIKNQSQESN